MTSTKQHSFQDTYHHVMYERILYDQFLRRGIIIDFVGIQGKPLVIRKNGDDGKKLDTKEQAIEYAFSLLDRL